MKREHGRKMQSKKSYFFSGSRVIRVAFLAVIFHISTFTVLVIIFLLEKEANLDVVATRSHVDVINTSIHSHNISAKSFSVSFTYISE